MVLTGQKTDKVDCWRSSNQKPRWLATAVLDIEPGFRFVTNFIIRVD
jgi:hypothetical protein